MSSDAYVESAAYYDHLTPYRNRGDVQFWVNCAREARGPVLELGCGTGRVLIPCAQAGAAITGLDASPAMLRELRATLAGEPPEVRARVTLADGDMRRFDLGQRFALITIPFRPFQHLVEVEDQLACLRTIHKHLTDKGRLVFDCFNPKFESMMDERRSIETEDVPEITLADGRKMRRAFRRTNHDVAKQVQDIELIYYVRHPDGRETREVHAFAMRYFFRYELEHLLARAGFEVEALYADYDKSPIGSKYPGELIFVARRGKG